MNKTLMLQDISKEYTQGKSIIKVLNNINLTIEAGEMVAIVGASGSGKSTLLHITGLLDNSTSGKVILPGANFKDKNLIRLHHLGFIYQQHHLLKDFTARENIALPKLIASGDYKTALQEADQLLSELGLYAKANNMPGELSGGEQQRIAIARSLINKPSIILADEPTGNLDPDTAAEVFNLFLKITKQQNTSIIMVTHNIELAERMDKVYEVRHGELYTK